MLLCGCVTWWITTLLNPPNFVIFKKKKNICASFLKRNLHITQYFTVECDIGKYLLIFSLLRDEKCVTKCRRAVLDSSEGIKLLMFYIYKRGVIRHWAFFLNCFPRMHKLWNMKLYFASFSDVFTIRFLLRRVKKETGRLGDQGANESFRAQETRKKEVLYAEFMWQIYDGGFRRVTCHTWGYKECNKEIFIAVRRILKVTESMKRGRELQMSGGDFQSFQ